MNEPWIATAATEASDRLVDGLSRNESRAMVILPGLTSTRGDRIFAFVADLRSSPVRAIALFPTVLGRTERSELYNELASVPGLRIPHVHLRSDCNEEEMQFLVTTFATERFNIHPAADVHAFGPVPPGFRDLVFVENVQEAPDDAELEVLGGICPDYAHLESARRLGRHEYVATVERQFREYHVGCCHVSAVRAGDPNPWNGGEDHHHFTSLADFDYMEAYADVLPQRWISLELENPLGEQMEAAKYLEHTLERAGVLTKT